MFLARHKLYFHALHSVKVCDLYFVGYYEDVSRFRWRSLRVCNIVFVLCSYQSFNLTCVVVCLLLRFSNGASRCSLVKVFFLLIKSSKVQESLNLRGTKLLCSLVIRQRILRSTSVAFNYNVLQNVQHINKYILWMNINPGSVFKASYHQRWTQKQELSHQTNSLF